MSKFETAQTWIMGALAAGFVIAAADDIINGSAQEQYCDAKRAEADIVLSDPSLNERFQSILDDNTEIRLTWAYDAANDPEFPRIPVLGTTTCHGFYEAEIVSPE